MIVLLLSGLVVPGMHLLHHLLAAVAAIGLWGLAVTRRSLRLALLMLRVLSVRSGGSCCRSSGSGGGERRGKQTDHFFSPEFKWVG